MSCKPGTPCYSYGQDFIYPRNCGIDPCFVYKTGTDLVFYNGPNLPCTGIHTCDTSTLSFEKIDAAICNLQTQLQNCCTTTTTTTTSSTTTTTSTTAIPCNCFTVSGGGPSTPVTQVTYLDCNGSSQQTAVGGGFDANFCALLGSIVTSQSITDNGVCSGQCPPTTTTTTTGIPCNCYTVDGGTPSTPIETITYTACTGFGQIAYAGNGVGAAFCAEVGSVSVTGGAIIVDNGACTGNCPTCCTTWMFIGDLVSLVTFQYVPCGGTTTVTISPGTTPEYRCVNNNYPVTQVAGNPAVATNTQGCCT